MQRCMNSIKLQIGALIDELKCKINGKLYYKLVAKETILLVEIWQKN